MDKKTILLMGRLPDIVANVEAKLSDMPVRFVGATSAEEVRMRLRDEPVICLAIMGAGLADATRGELIKIIAEARPDISIHLKDRASGPAGMALFVRKVCTAMIGLNLEG